MIAPARSDQSPDPFGAPRPGVLPPRAEAAARLLIDRVRAEVPARLVQASLFGSRARGTERPDSDVDILLVWRQLPPDREPHATHAEDIAEQVAAQTGVPVTVWSVSLVDLEQGRRTPMLIDALDDSIPLWYDRVPLPALPFTPDDALHCTDALLTRIEEGAEELAEHLERRDRAAAARRVRDDVVRLCTAGLLLHGETRPRRADAVRRFVESEFLPARAPRELLPLFRWAEASFGPEGRDEDAPVPPPPGGLAPAAALVERLRRWTQARAAALGAGSRGGNPMRV